MMRVFCLAFFLLGCQIKFEVPPPKSALENQLIGLYEIDPDEYLSLLSHRGENILAKQYASLSGKQKFYLAVKSRTYNKDDLELLLKLGWIGETNSGLIERLPASYRNPSSQVTLNERGLSNLARYILRQENMDRKTIVSYQINGKDINSAESTKELFEELYRLRVGSIPEGVYYQDERGSWKNKGVK